MNFAVLLIAAGFFWHMNSYFGWNASPKSDAELIADGILFLIIAIGFSGVSK